MKQHHVFSFLQRMGKSFMLPIAVLPVAGIFLGVGSSLTNETTIICGIAFRISIRARNLFILCFNFIEKSGQNFI